jgi:DNA-binding response OmpR family regulator
MDAQTASVTSRAAPKIATKHSVLSLHFPSATTACQDRNSQTVDPDEALRRLQAGDAWAVLATSGEDVHALTNWLMRLRHRVGGRLPGVIVFLPDCATPGALLALQAGADALLPIDSPPALIRTQLARLRERISPQPEGCLWLLHEVALDAQTRTLLLQGQKALQLPTQQFHLLWTLGCRAGEVLSPQELRVAMDIPARAPVQAVHTAVARLRRLLRPFALHQSVQTVHRCGYRWAGSEGATHSEIDPE